MAVLFVSHASRDDAMARPLEAWLRAKGFTDLFIDHSNIDAGEKWAQALRDAAGACRVVVCLVTENWLASDECFGEFKAAWYMGKRIIPLFALGVGERARPDRLSKVQAEDQGLDVASCRTDDGGFDLVRDAEIERRLENGLRAAGALARIGLDPEAFAIDRKLRPTPFPGLASFSDEDADAALFYGRSREIAEAMEELREMRATGDSRPYVIIGASGSGKSSMLKAGIIPRLRREPSAWLPLRAFRPSGDPLYNFAEALTRTLTTDLRSNAEAPGALCARLFDQWAEARRPVGKPSPDVQAALQTALDDFGARLRKAAGRSAATILVSLDQAEELARADSDAGDALAAYLRAASAMTRNRWRIVLTIRTDSFPDFQRHRRFEDWETRPRDLRTVKGYRFDTIIEEPAKRYGVRVDLKLVEALIEDAPTEDALPLLAYSLQRLWLRYADSGSLILDTHARIGQLSKLIEDGAERALRGLSPDEDAPLPPGPLSKNRLDLAASTFVPALAQVNERGVTIRRIAQWASFSEEQRDLLARFDQWRLVVRKGEPGTVEVAHDALFREWKRLASWLESERTRLEALRALQVDALTWDRNGRDTAYLNHRGRRLAEANALSGIVGYRRRLTALEFDYLAACRVANIAHLENERVAQVVRVALAVFWVAAFLVVANMAFVWDRINWFFTMRPYRIANFDGNALSLERERALRPGDPPFHECVQACPEMVVVPAGEFQMGSPGSEKGRDGNEGPQHRVSIIRQFAVADNDVTFDEWDECFRVGGCPKADDAPMGRRNKPVVNVSFDEAQSYAAWLSRMTGKPYRLLNEAEWEYSARGGTKTAYYWSDEIGKDNANCDDCGSKWDGREASPVGSFKVNPFGLYDMAGNVWQWVEDCYHDDYKGAPANGETWTGGDCIHRVLRGGSWNVDPRALRSADRIGVSPGSQSAAIGFRVARTLTQ
jgi:formylglycine-generating enzyme required for sulfatase activity